MLSRSVIHRTPGESPRPAPVRPADGRAAGDTRLKGTVFTRGMVLAALAALLMLFLLLNMNGVVEPNMRFLFLRYDHARLLPVMLITSVLSIACTLAALGVANAKRHLREAHRRSLTEAVEHEASRIEHDGVSHRGVPQPVSAS